MVKQLDSKFAEARALTALAEAVLEAKKQLAAVTDDLENERQAVEDHIEGLLRIKAALGLRGDEIPDDIIRVLERAIRGVVAERDLLRSEIERIRGDLGEKSPSDKLRQLLARALTTRNRGGEAGPRRAARARGGLEPVDVQSGQGNG